MLEKCTQSQPVVQRIIESTTDDEVIALNALKAIWQNTPPNWVGVDPCGDSWEGIGCTNSRVTSMELPSMGLQGQLSGDIQGLSELQTLVLSYNVGLTGSLPSSIGNLKNLLTLSLIGCSFVGPIPDTIGSLEQLTYLALNSNRFIGTIPPSIGNLLKLYWLDLADNQLTGTVPVSTATAPGLDMLVNALHLLFKSNQLTGSIPSSLGLVKTLEVVRFDRNSLIGPVPSNLNNLTNLNELYLSNNKLTGPVPTLTGMNFLNTMDMSNNSFNVSNVSPWFSTLQSLTTLTMDNTQLQGQVPEALFSLPNLQTVVLRNNQLNGILDIGASYSNQLQLIDLQNNLIQVFAQRSNGANIDLILVGNPICNGSRATGKYCTASQPNSSYPMPPNNCVPFVCSSDKIEPQLYMHISLLRNPLLQSSFLLRLRKLKLLHNSPAVSDGLFSNP